jgi:hypothetical protein
VSLVLNFAQDGTLIVICPYYGSDSRLRGDIDNYIKTIMDGLNGVAWDDDKQVFHVVAEKTMKVKCLNCQHSFSADPKRTVGCLCDSDAPTWLGFDT